jgi:alkylhydroperoxidase family enzyme
MARVPFVSREDLAPEDRHIWDDFAAPRAGRVENNPRMMLNSPQAAARIFALNTYLRFNAGIPTKELAIATLTAGAEAGSEYVVAWHRPSALDKGVSEATVQAICSQTSLDGIPEDEALIARYARAVARTEMTDGIFDAALEAYGVRMLMDISVVVGQYTLMHLIGSAFGVSRDPDWEPLLV